MIRWGGLYRAFFIVLLLQKSSRKSTPAAVSDNRGGSACALLSPSLTSRVRKGLPSRQPRLAAHFADGN
jgi:hypothetical protein